MESKVEIKTLQKSDIENVLKALDEPYMLSRKEQYKEYFNRCVEENIKGDRVTFLVVTNCNDVVGYVNMIFSSQYSYFKARSIPEINDLYVVPKYRKNGIYNKI